MTESTERPDYSANYSESTTETIVGLYSKRDEHGKPKETVNDIIWRVAEAVAIAELRYLLKPEELIQLSIGPAKLHPTVVEMAKTYAHNIGNQYFWANTPANINADPEVSLKVLQYEAHGKLAGLEIKGTWMRSEELRGLVIQGRLYGLSEHEHEMGKLSAELYGKGCLAACGVTHLEDSLAGIQEAARVATLAAKSAMGIGFNTSPLRPWNSVVANGAAASGPDRFYEKSIAKAVEAVAQGGRRGGALIEIRNSDHPDILFFIDKKKLIPPPVYAKVLEEIQMANPKARYSELIKLAGDEHAKRFTAYWERQNYLKNTNISVLVMPGFMEAVRDKKWYPAQFEGKNWTGKLYDPRRPLLDENGIQKVDKLTKELMLEQYAVDCVKYPEALDCRGLDIEGPNLFTRESAKTVGGKQGYFYAPDVFDRICEGMRDSGEPGIQFYEAINAGNANPHHYDLNTTNPCSEQSLEAGPSKGFGHLEGFKFAGVCNLSSMHAAHPSYWPDRSKFLDIRTPQYDFAKMRAVTSIQMHFMDSVIDVSWFPLPAQNLTSRLCRRTGGGFAGVAEYLSRLGKQFGSGEARKSVQKLYAEYAEACLEASKSLAVARGTYPLWEGSRYQEKGLAVRNTCMTNNAPTGTLAQCMQTTWGVDPHNGIVFSRKVRSRFVDFVAPGFEDAMREVKAWPDTPEGQQELMKTIRANNKSCRGLDEVPKEIQDAFPIRAEISPRAYIKHLAAIHEGLGKACPETFNAISNTCAIPLGCEIEVVKEAVLQAWRLGVKALTFYPDGSRACQPVEKIAAADYERTSSALDQFDQMERRKIDVQETEGRTFKVNVGVPTGTSTLHVSLNHEKNRPGELVEIYARMGKPGAVEGGLFEAVGRLASVFLQYAAQFGEDERQKAEDSIVNSLIGIQSGYSAWNKFGKADKPETINSPCDGLAKAIREYRRCLIAKANEDLAFISEKAEKGMWWHVPPKISPVFSKDYQAQLENSPNLLCPKCGSDEFTTIDGCECCGSCGFSKC